MEKFNDARFQAVEFAKAFESAFEESFKGIIKGTMTVQDAFRSMFMRIADHFLDMAAQMVSTQITKGILGLIAGSFALVVVQKMFLQVLNEDQLIQILLQ